MTERHRRSAPGIGRKVNTYRTAPCSSCGEEPSRGVIIHTETCKLFPSGGVGQIRTTELDPELTALREKLTRETVDNREALRTALASRGWQSILGAWYPARDSWDRANGAVAVSFDSINDDDVVIAHEKDDVIWTVAMTANTPLAIMLNACLW